MEVWLDIPKIQVKKYLMKSMFVLIMSYTSMIIMKVGMNLYRLLIGD